MDKIDQGSVLKVKQNINTAWKNLQEIVEKENQQKQIEGFEENIKQMQAGTFRLVVMGEIKKGKSSFINALLGEEDLLPTASDVATSTVYQIIYGSERKVKVYFLPDLDTGKHPPSLEISEAQLPEYGTEDGNPDNKKQVDFIAVEVPNELLRTGLVIVDTPGVGGLFKKHKNITWKYAPNADAIFFILDSTESVISQDEITFLQDLTETMTKRIYFVQTKIDIPGEEQWKAWEKRNKDILVEKLDIPSTKLKYFPASSKLKQRGDKKNKERFIKDSGFPIILDFLQNNLIAHKDILICREVAGAMTGLFKSIRTAISQRTKIAQADTKEKLAELDANIKQAIQEMGDWERTVYRKAVQNFSDSFQDIKRLLGNQIQNELTPNGALMDMIENVRSDNNSTPVSLNKIAGELQQRLIDDSSASTARTQEKFNEGIRTLTLETVSKLTESLNNTESLSFNSLNCDITETLNVHIQKTLHMQFSHFESARNIFYGGMAGGSIACMALSLFFPPAGAAMAIGSIIGGLFGGWKMNAIAKNRKKEEAISKLKQMLSATIIQIQRQAIQQFQDMAVQSERNARKLFDQALDLAKDSLNRQQQEINNAKNATNEEMEEVITEAKSLVSIIDSSVKMISGI